MGRAVLRFRGQSSALLLGATNLIGRHWSCHTCVDDPSVPLYWLEIRWQEGVWLWRCLAAADRTVGTGTVMPNGWRRWTQDRSTLRLGQSITIQLTDDSPPELLLQDIESGERRAGSQLEELVEVSEWGVRLLGREGAPWIGDGGVIQHERRAWRVWLPREWQTLSEARLSLESDELVLELNPERVLALFVHGQESIHVDGALARLLLTYALARIEQDARAGGWLDKAGAFEAWLEVGGSPQSHPNRIAWERGKLRSFLVRQGVLRTDLLFERKQERGRWFHRLFIEPERIRLS